MKLTRAFALSSLYSVACAAGVGHVYIHDPIPRSLPQASSSVDPETARLILAQRLGLSRFHSVKNPSDEAVQQINAFGGRQQKLFGWEDPKRTQAQLLVWVEDVEDVTAIIKDSSKWTSSFTISTPPPTSDNDRLVQDMILQADSLPKKAGSKGNTYAAITTIDALVRNSNHPSIHNEYVSVLREDGKNAGQLVDLIEELRSSSTGEQGHSITVVVMPPSSSRFKRSWGSYDIPSNLQPRRELTEAPLAPFTAKLATSPIPDVSDHQDLPPITQAEGNNTTPPLGILPSCFDKLSKCEKETHSCSGHGTCGLRGKGGKNRNCYACSCTSDVKNVGDKGMESRIKTTYWGGPACQKKDVSVPFWLFVASGVLLAFLISTGIGMLYSMGSEELPSVIGAGVSGPVRK